MSSLGRACGAGFLVTFLLAGADLRGIWMGEVTGRNGEKQDLAFRFQSSNGGLAGVMFGDEFDLPVEDLRIEGNHISFSVTSINYYDGRRIKSLFSGTLSDKTLELTRQPSNAETPADPAKPKQPVQTMTLKRLT